jgi:glycosyltransferase involved in cell wall biosynthesis
MVRFFARALLRATDWARVHRMSRSLAYAALIPACLLGPSHRIAAVARILVTSHPNRFRSRLISAAVGIARAQRDVVERVELIRSIILKRAISPRERGIILVSFESELEKLTRLARFPELERKYAILFLPTWQPFYSSAFFRLAAKAQRPYWIMPSTRNDCALCDEFGPLCRALPFQASSWVSSNVRPRERVAKTIDFLMLANFSTYKRHWRLFEALCDMPVEYEVVVAGRELGKRTIDSVRWEAEAFGVADRVRFIENPTDEQVADLLASAKVFCALSHKEGSYIAVAEALQAGTPVAMYSDARIGSKEYIGPETGVLLESGRPLAPQLMHFVNRAGILEPAGWARIHISADVNCRKLDHLMYNESIASGDEWTEGLSPFHCKHFDFKYSTENAEHQFAPEYAKVSAQFGLSIRRSDCIGKLSS